MLVRFRPGAPRYALRATRGAATLFRFSFIQQMCVRDLAACFARGFANSLSLCEQRAQGMPGARCTRGLVCQKLRIWRTRAYRFSRNIPAFPAQWLYGLLRALPGERAFLPPSLADNSTSLTPASRRQDHTTWPYASAFRPAQKAPDAKASIASPAQRIVTIAKRPSCGPGCAKKCQRFARRDKRNIFDCGA